MLASDEAVASYQELRLKLQAARKVRADLRRPDVSNAQTGEDDEIA
jgi:hypothetical protein